MDQNEIWIARHGATEWSEAWRHTGRTDIPLTDDGTRQAVSLVRPLAAHRFALVLTSPLLRARETARIAGFADAEVDPDLLEWDYGDYEGRTTDEIRETLGDPAWTVWTTARGLGESPEQVGERVSRVIDRVRPMVDRGDDVVLVAHAHVLRILTAVWLGLPPAYGAHFVLAAAGTGVLGYERDVPALRSWNS